MAETIYLDNNATTALDPRVLETVIAELSGPPANPSGVHQFGQVARNKLTKARRLIAEQFEVRPQEVIFTSGGTEGLNLVLRGLCPPGSHLITSSADHLAVLKTAAVLEESGVAVDRLAPDAGGALSPQAVAAAIRPQTRCIATLAVNNETGVMNDLELLSSLALDYRIPLVIDGVALLGKERFSIPEGVSAILFSGHKIHAPKGVGFAIIRNGLRLAPQITGGGQEYGRRGGTENLSSIVGLAHAIALLDEELPRGSVRMRAQRDRLEEAICSNVPGAVVNGTGRRVSNTSNISFPGLDVEALMMNLDMEGLAVSHASACSSGALEPSHVIEAMGLGRERALTSLRFSLSRFTTDEEINAAIELVIQHALRLSRWSA
jgi:cysteine desulfurase